MTSRRTRRAGLLLGGMALTISLAACAESQTQEEAEGDVCESLAAVEAAADEVRAVDSATVVEEAEAAVDELAASLQQLRAEAADLQEADADALEASADEIRSAIGDTDPEQSIGDNVDAVADSTEAMDSALAEIRDGLGCG